MRKSIQKSNVFCPACQVGNYHLKLVTYTTWLEDDLITAPDFPAWVCDVCGRIDFDDLAVRQLNSLLASSTDLRLMEETRKKHQRLQTLSKARRTPKSRNE